MLTTLKFADNNIRAEGAAAIAEALRGDGVLTDLNLWGHDIGDEGALGLCGDRTVTRGRGRPRAPQKGAFYMTSVLEVSISSILVTSTSRRVERLCQPMAYEL